MTKEQKIQLVEKLTEKFKEYPNFYIADAGGLTVAETSELRQLCFDGNVQLQMVKNTLIKKSLENLDNNYEEVFDVLKKSSSIFFSTSENPSGPAKIIEKFRKTKEKPLLKVACIDSSVFIGDDQLKTLTSLKSKDELIGEIIGLLQSPAKNVISALKSSGGKLAGILQTLSEREE